jgi:hypothetical protein
MDGWTGKAALTLFAAFVVWNIYKGATVQELGIPGFTVKFGGKSESAPSVPPLEQAIAGSWRYEMTSNVSGNKYVGAVDLVVTGNMVSGGMDNPDPTKQGERSSVQGNIINGTMTLRRDTNLNGISQEYRLSMKGDKTFAGSFSNVGITSGPYHDSGEIRIFR